jgi:hypothetical protein
MTEQVNNNSSGAKQRTPVTRSAAFDPRNPALVQPYKRLIEEGFFTELVVTFTPLGVTSTAKPDIRLASVEGASLDVNQSYPLGVLSAWADKGNLIPLKGKKGKKIGNATPDQPLPDKSLCKRDFLGTAAELSARAVAVANKSGGSALIGRVRSEGHFRMGVTTSFQNWWAQASPADRASALCVPRYRGELTAEDLNKLAGLQCPFRGTAEFTVVEEVEDPDGEESEVEKLTVQVTPTTAKVVGAASTAAKNSRKAPVKK